MKALFGVVVSQEKGVLQIKSGSRVVNLNLRKTYNTEITAKLSGFKKGEVVGLAGEWESRPPVIRSVWAGTGEVPAGVLKHYLKGLSPTGTSAELETAEMLIWELLRRQDLLKDREILAILKLWVKSPRVLKRPLDYARAVPQMLMGDLAENLQVLKCWQQPKIPDWLPEVTELLLGPAYLQVYQQAWRKKYQKRNVFHKSSSDNQIDSLIKKFRENPAGIRNESRLREICIKCGSSDVQPRSESERYFKVCRKCGNEWYVNHCWNCGLPVDGRDPENPECPECGWLKCVCGACYIRGCRTNPYHKNNRLKDYGGLIEPLMGDTGDYGWDPMPEMCDWCGVHPVSYRDEAFHLCESCSDQLFGD
ncbi:MAG: hypothetical protein Kow0037_30870 [Calditrichia bacterium]